MASDGINTAQDESDAVFLIADKSPEVVILQPENEAAAPEGVTLLMRGTAHDVEDGSLSGTSLSWSSDRDGALGLGSQLVVTLSAGEHLITLEGTDSDGRVNTDTIQVTIVPPVDCEPFPASLSDCNANGIDDACELGLQIRRDHNGNGILNECEPAVCLADLTGDGVANLLDFSRISLYWMQAEPTVDLLPLPNGNGIVGQEEANLLISFWLQTCP